jgi:hypothetical protein
MKRDDIQFAGAIIITLFLMVATIYSFHLRGKQEAAGPTVDLKKIEAQAQKGVIGFHEASWWERAEDKP